MKQILSIPVNDAVNVRTVEKFILLYCFHTNRKKNVRREHVIVSPTLADEIVKIVAKIDFSDDHTLFFGEDDIQIDFTRTGYQSGMKRHKDWMSLNANKRARPNFVLETSLRNAVVDISNYY